MSARAVRPITAVSVARCGCVGQSCGGSRRHDVGYPAQPFAFPLGAIPPRMSCSATGYGARDVTPPCPTCPIATPAVGGLAVYVEGSRGCRPENLTPESGRVMRDIPKGLPRPAIKDSTTRPPGDAILGRRDVCQLDIEISKRP